MTDTITIGGSDVIVSWLPLYHDMGLIGAWLTGLYGGVRSVIMSPLAFLARPARWLRAIHAHGGTLSAAPNFAYDLCVARVPEEELKGLRLDTWRLALNGAEAVRPETIDRFCARFGPLGFRREAILPVYGLAECALALAFPPAGRGPLVDRIRREEFDKEGRVVPAAPDDPSSMPMVSCGHPLPGYEIRIVDETGHEQGDRQQGRIQFRGPSATSGYYRNPEATRRLFDGDWVESGDFGYFADGEIYITGRVKDIIIKAGRNMHPQELEQAVGLIPGVRKGCVAAFGSPDPESGTERLVVVAESRESDPARREETTQRIREATLATLGIPVDDVVLAPPHAVPKTPSGKLRRDHCRRLYETGEISRPPRAVAMQMTRLAVGALGSGLARAARAAGRWVYAAWAWSVFLVLGFFMTLALALLPALRWRRAAVRAACALFLRLAGLRVAVSGREHLRSPCVLAVNHSSYLDAIVLYAALPSDFSFVAKSEFRGKLLSRFFMGRLGVEFVERFDAEQGVKDIAAAGEVLKRGGSLVVFPEGTFTRAPGLRPFRMGAFVTAAQAGVPLVPASLRGVRSVLRDGSWMPRWGGIGFSVHPPLPPAGSDWSAAVRLRDEARGRILGACGEPELVSTT
jgi:1-acyl-sn-glycerol-3-phosphate acyltransferase